MAILGTSGAGKTFTMQLMALRMRRKNIQVFIIAPLKGHEFHRACSNIGGEFIQISPASRNCINVMEIRKVDSSANDILAGPQTEKSDKSTHHPVRRFLFPCRYSHSYLHRALPDNLPLQISLIYHSFLIFLPIAVTTLTLALVGCYGNGIAFCLFISIKIYRVCHGTATVSGS